MTARGDYGGDISPADALELLKQYPEATLVDVRTQPEWSFVGVPDLSGLWKGAYLPRMAVLPIHARQC